MLRAVIKKADNMQEQIGNISREVEILRKNQKEKIEIKSPVMEMKNAFDGLIWRRREEGTKEIFEVMLKNFQN